MSAASLTAPLFVSSGDVAKRRPGAGMLDRFLNALIEVRMEQARREIAYHLGTLPQDQLNKTGYRVTDRT